MSEADESESWIEVAHKGDRVWAHVYVNGGKTESTRHVDSRREVEDLAASYGISRSNIRYAEDIDLPEHPAT